MIDVRLDLVTKRLKVSFGSVTEIYVDTKSTWPCCHLQIGSSFCWIFVVSKENGDGKIQWMQCYLTLTSNLRKVGTLVQFITTDGAPTYLFNLSLFNAGAFHCKIYALVNTDPAIQQGCTACIALALSCTIVANPFKGRSFRSRNAFTL